MKRILFLALVLAWCCLFSAQAGEKEAQKYYNLAMTNITGLDINGNKVQVNEALGREYMEKSAREGNDLAQLLLGVMCCTGQGGPVDMQKGYYWVSASAAQGNEDAQWLLKEARIITVTENS